MKNKITLIILALCLLMPAVASAAGYRFDYDLSGNRTKRVYVPAQASLQVEQQPFAGFLPIYAVEPAIGGTGYCIVIAKLGTWSSTDLPQDGTTYPSGSDLGTWHVLYNGQTNIGLSSAWFTPLNTYTIVVYEYGFDNSASSATPVYNTEITSTNIVVTPFFKQNTANESQSLSLGELSPNPASDRVSFDVTTTEGGDYRVEVYSEQGQLALTKELSLNSGANQVALDLSTDAGGLPTGVYFLKLYNSTSSLTRKFVVKR